MIMENGVNIERQVGESAKVFLDDKKMGGKNDKIENFEDIIHDGRLLQDDQRSSKMARICSATTLSASESSTAVVASTPEPSDTLSTRPLSSASTTSTPTTSLNDRSSSSASNNSNSPLLEAPSSFDLYSLPHKKLLILSLTPIISSLALVFIIGFGFDYKKLLNYQWTCGKVLLPSLSRIINLPIERVLWHFGVVLHAGLRPIYLIQAYVLNLRVKKNVSYKWLIKFLALTSLVSGFIELLFTIALTIIGERESGGLHVVFFVGFIISALINFISSTLCFRFSKVFDENSKLHPHFRTRITLIVLLLLFVPTIFLFFVLYWQECIRIAYEFFAIFEYLTVLVVYGNHLMILMGLKNLDCKVIKE
ncbi:unnamed protein product [Bursaphelenchus xylophilus]|uniref:(pine wood nematode) hypothetical protein n=1 Tax=Bursaphelenchus xylophilus TaxID=6326 RepID=A0A1I7RNU2_BURXY|nr:unnamed protein product [Bursaphelenchus xylophilus]CAG9124295.1 unnamed protein product [Bursaphelenchus xylophilus]